MKNSTFEKRVLKQWRHTTYLKPSKKQSIMNFWVENLVELPKG